MTTAFENDLTLAKLVHSICATLSNDACAGMPDCHAKPARRFGDRKCFVSAIWRVLVQDHADEVEALDCCNLADFKLWLLDAMRLVDDDGVPLILLARADLVGAMDRYAVQASELEDRGATFHFVLDRKAGAADYLALRSTPTPAKSPDAPKATLDAIVLFLRSHRLQALSICGHVHFECADGIQHKVRTMAEAAAILGY